MPVSPHNVTGTIRNIFGDILAGASVSVAHATIDPTLTATTDSDGVYTVNLGQLESQWSVGDTITIVANKTAEGRVTLETTISSGGGQTHNLTLAETSDFDFERQSDLKDRYPFSMVMPVHYDGGLVTRERPLPVSSSEIDLLYNPAHSWAITRQDGQPDSETVVIQGDTYTRTFTYNSDGIMTARTAWVKQ